MKTCPRCKQAKSPDEFASNGRLPDGSIRYHSYCRPCLRIYQQEWNQANPGSHRAAKRRWIEEHPDEVRDAKRRRYHANQEKSRERQREWRRNHPEQIAARAERNRTKARDEGRYAFYSRGVTLEQRREIEAGQGGRCAICETDLATTSRPSIDHNHTTGAVRGILCNKCNAALGWFETRRDRVLDYLKRQPVHPGKPPSDRRLKPHSFEPRPRKLATHCKQGHEMSPGNLYVGADGRRRCKKCTRRYAAERLHRLHPEKPEYKPRRKVWRRSANVCKNGHELTPDNVYVKGDGSRRCRICTREYIRARWRAAHPDAPNRV